MYLTNEQKAAIVIGIMLISLNAGWNIYSLHSKTERERKIELNAAGLPPDSNALRAAVFKANPSYYGKDGKLKKWCKARLIASDVFAYPVKLPVNLAYKVRDAVSDAPDMLPLPSLYRELRAAQPPKVEYAADRLVAKLPGPVQQVYNATGIGEFIGQWGTA